MSQTRQERRRQERKAKKTQKRYDLEMQMIQPWSCPILKTKLPPDILGKMLEITDRMVENKKNEKSWGVNLAGQVEHELLINHDDLYEAGVMGFFLDIVRHYVIQCKVQQMGPKYENAVRSEEWLVQMLSCWVVNQYPGEYNPTHIHTQCQISTAMYLKVPKFEDSLKKHRNDDDGSICFTGPASRDIDLSNPQWSWRPEVGDFFIFGAHQFHHVYPYKCSEGDPERRCVSFNAIFQSKSDHEAQLEAQKKQNQEADLRVVQGRDFSESLKKL